MTQLADYRPKLTIIDISDPYNISVSDTVRFGGDYPGTTAWGSDVNGGTYRVVVDDVYDCSNNSNRRIFNVGIGGGTSYIAAPSIVGRESMELIIHDFDTAHEVILSDWVNTLPIINHNTGIVTGQVGNLIDMNAAAATNDGHYIFAGGGFTGYIGQSGGTWSFYVDDENNPLHIAGGNPEGWWAGWSTMAPVDYAINGSYMYLISHYDDEFFDFPNSHGFNIVYIADRENPQLIKWVNKPLDSDVDEPDQVKVHDGYCYVTCNGSSKLLVYDVQEFFENNTEWPEGILFSTQAEVGDGYYLYRHPFDTLHYTTGIFGDDEIIKPSPDQTAWALTDYTYRKKITVNSQNTVVTQDEIGFPVGLRFETGDDIFDNTLVNGYDVRFTAVDGTNLDYERSVWDDGVEANFWVSCTLNSGTPTYFYMYYDYAAAGNVSATTVWDNADYDIVYHFEEASYDGTASEIKDATANSNDAYRKAGSWQPEAGTWGNQIDTGDGTADRAQLDSNLSVGASYTISSLFSVPMVSHGQQRCLTSHQHTQYCHIIADNNTGFPLGCRDNYNWYGCGFDMDDLADGLHHVAVVRNASDGKGYFYIDGEFVGSSTQAPQSYIKYLGGNEANDSWGPIDEFRVALEEKSASWIQAEGYNLVDYDNFITVGREQEQPNGDTCIETYLYWTGTIYPELITTTGVTADIQREQGAPEATITAFTTSSITFRVTCADLDWGNGYQVRITEDSSGFSVYGIPITVAKSKECNDENRYLCYSEDICNATGGIWYEDWYEYGWCFDP
jgi:hypothetical protein